MTRTATLGCVLLLLLAAARAQQAGHQQANNHPPLPISVCTRGRGCTPEPTAVTIDSNWLWLHKVGGQWRRDKRESEIKRRTIQSGVRDPPPPPKKKKKKKEV